MSGSEAAEREPTSGDMPRWGNRVGRKKRRERRKIIAVF